MSLFVHGEGRKDLGLLGSPALMPAPALRPTAAGRAVFAALDLGTNNCRLLIARPAPTGFRVIDAFSRIVRLGEGLSRSERLSPQAMERTLEALRVCGSKIERRGVTAARAVGTEACRRARNCGEFIDAVERETGIAIEIISSQEEGRLAIAGCAALLDPSVPFALVFDIGGGSTELMWLAVEPGRQPRLLDQISIRCGVIGLAERYGGDRLAADRYRAMVEEVVDLVAPFTERNGIADRHAAGRVQMLGTSGTVTTLAGVHLGLPRYDRRAVDGSFLRLDHARSIIAKLVALDFAGRAGHPCIGPERADLVVAGCAVLEAICDCCPVQRLRIADRGLREGILVDLIGAAQA
ncbi:Ppx/GppA phosphatase family protein [Azospirillum sp. ST 5-10]|uniref:Ppx/GppA phosphatase family protein n=1 Tax=unclassified Azospirillum TaxID=2630922 RepID=UPI003F4A4C9B